MKVPKRIQSLICRYGSTGKVDFDNGSICRNIGQAKALRRWIKHQLRKQDKEEIAYQLKEMELNALEDKRLMQIETDKFIKLAESMRKFPNDFDDIEECLLFEESW